MAKIGKKNAYLNINTVNNIQDEQQKKNQNNNPETQEQTPVENHIKTVNDTEGSLFALEQLAMHSRIKMSETQGAAATSVPQEETDNSKTIQITDKMSVTVSIETNGGFSYTIKDNIVTFFGTDCTITINRPDEGDLDDIDVELKGSGITLNSDAHVNSITNNAVESIINGSDQADHIINRANHSIVHGHEGADTIVSSGFGAIIDGGADDDSITSTGDYSTINGSSGENNIFAQGFNVNVEKSIDSGETSSDSIVARGSGVTVDVSENENSVIADGSNIEIKSGSGAKNDIELTGINNKVTDKSENDYIVNNSERDTETSATPNKKNGFDSVTGKTYINDKLVTGLYVDNKMYSNGELLTGVSDIDNKYYANGNIPSGFRLDDNTQKYYYKGVIANGTIDGIEFINGVCQGTPPVIVILEERDGYTYCNGDLADSVNLRTGAVTFIEGDYYRFGKKLCTKSEYETCIALVNSIKENNPDIENGADIANVTYCENSGLIKSFSTVNAQNTSSDITAPNYSQTLITTYTVEYDVENNISTISTTIELEDDKTKIINFDVTGVEISETTYQNDERISAIEYDGGYRYEISYTNNKPAIVNIYNNETNEVACTQTYSYTETSTSMRSDYPDNTYEILITDTSQDIKNLTGYDANGNETCYAEYNGADSSDITFQRDIDDYLGLYIESVQYNDDEIIVNDFLQISMAFANGKLTSFSEIDAITCEQMDISDIVYDPSQNLILYKKSDLLGEETYYTVSSTTGIPTETEINTIKHLIFEGGELANCTINGVTYVGGEIQVAREDNFTIGDDGKLYNNGALAQGLKEYNHVTYYNGNLADSVNAETSNITFIEGGYYRVGQKLCTQSEYETCIALVNSIKENNPDISIGSDISCVTYYDGTDLIKSFCAETSTNSSSDVKKPSYYATGRTRYTVTYDAENNPEKISTTKELENDNKQVTEFSAGGVKTAILNYNADKLVSKIEYSGDITYTTSYDNNERPSTKFKHEEGTLIWTKTFAYNGAETTETTVLSTGESQVIVTNTEADTKTTTVYDAANNEISYRVSLHADSEDLEYTFYRAEIAPGDIYINFVTYDTVDEVEQMISSTYQFSMAYQDGKLNSFVATDYYTVYDTISDIAYDSSQNLILYKKTDLLGIETYYTVSSTTGIPTETEINTIKHKIFEGEVLANCTINGVTYVEGVPQENTEPEELTEEQQAFLTNIDSMRSDLTVNDIQTSSISFTGNNNVTFTTADGNTWICTQNNSGYNIKKIEEENEKYEEATYNLSQQLSKEVIVDTSNTKAAKITKEYDATTTRSTIFSQTEETNYGLITKYQTFGDSAQTYTIDEENYYNYMDTLNSLTETYPEIEQYIDISLLIPRESENIDKFIDFKLSEAVIADIGLLDEADDMVKADTTGQLTFKNALKSLMISDYTNSTKSNTDIILETEHGDVIQKDNKLYVHDVNNELVELKMDIDTYIELFPPVGRYTANQNGYGDCFFVSGVMLGCVENKSAFSELLKMFAVNQTTGDITITFKGVYLNDYPVTFENGELFDIDLSCYQTEEYELDHSLGMSTGVKGVMMLEQAYSLALFAYLENKEIDDIDIDQAVDDIIGHGGLVYEAEDNIFATEYYVTLNFYLGEYGKGNFTETNLNNIIQPLYDDYIAKRDIADNYNGSINFIYEQLSDSNLSTAIEKITYYGKQLGYDNIWDELADSNNISVSNLYNILEENGDTCYNELLYLMNYEGNSPASNWFMHITSALSNDDRYCGLANDVYASYKMVIDASDKLDYYLSYAITNPYDSDEFNKNVEEKGLYYALLADRDTYIEDCADTLALNNAVITLATRSLDLSGFVQDENADSKFITDGHNYLIESIDKENRTITIINPWEGGLTTEITYDDLYKYFCRVDALVTPFLEDELTNQQQASVDSVFSSWNYGAEYKDDADDFVFDENNNLLSFKIFDDDSDTTIKYSVLYNGTEQIGVMTNDENVSNVYQFNEDADFISKLENNYFDKLKDTVIVYPENYGVDGNNTTYTYDKNDTTLVVNDANNPTESESGNTTNKQKAVAALVEFQNNIDKGETQTKDISQILKTAEINISDSNNDNKIDMDDLINIANDYLTKNNELTNIKTAINLYNSAIEFYETTILQVAPGEITRENLKSKLDEILNTDNISNEVKQNISILKDLYEEKTSLESQKTIIEQQVATLKTEYDETNVKEFFTAYLENEIEKLQNSDSENNAQELSFLQDLLAKVKNNEIINGLQGNVQNSATSSELMMGLQDEISKLKQKAQNDYPTSNDTYPVQPQSSVNPNSTNTTPTNNTTQSTSPTSPTNSTSPTQSTTSTSTTESANTTDETKTVDDVEAIAFANQMTTFTAEINHLMLASFENNIMDNSSCSVAVALTEMQKSKKELTNLLKSASSQNPLPKMVKDGNNHKYITIDGKTIHFNYDDSNNLTSVSCDGICTVVAEYDNNHKVTNLTWQRKAENPGNYQCTYDATMSMKLDTNKVIQECTLDYDVSYANILADGTGHQTTHVKTDGNSKVLEYTCSGQESSSSASATFNTSFNPSSNQIIANEVVEGINVVWTVNVEKENLSDWSAVTGVGIPIKSGKLISTTASNGYGWYYVWSGDDVIKINGLGQSGTSETEEYAMAVAMNLCAWPDAGYDCAFIPSNSTFPSEVVAAYEILGKTFDLSAYNVEVEDDTTEEEPEIITGEVEPEEYTFTDPSGVEQVGLFYPEHYDEEGNFVPAQKYEEGTYKNGNTYQINKIQNEDGTWTGEEVVYAQNDPTYLKQTSTIEYDENGVMISKSYDCFDKSGNITEKGTIEYDENGVKISSDFDSFNTKGKYKHCKIEYNEQGKRIYSEGNFYMDLKDNDGNVIAYTNDFSTTKTTYTYDDSGNQTGFTEIIERAGQQTAKKISTTTEINGVPTTVQEFYDSNNKLTATKTIKSDGNFETKLANGNIVSSGTRINFGENSYMTTTDNGDPMLVTFNDYDITVSNQSNMDEGLYNLNGCFSGSGWTEELKAKILGGYKTMPGQGILDMFKEVKHIVLYDKSAETGTFLEHAYYDHTVSSDTIYVNKSWLTNATSSAIAKTLLHEGGEGHARDAKEDINDNDFLLSHDENFQKIVQEEREQAVALMGEYNKYTGNNGSGAYVLRNYGTESSQYEGEEVVAKYGEYNMTGTTSDETTLLVYFPKSIEYVHNTRANDKATISLMDRARKAYNDGGVYGWAGEYLSYYFNDYFVDSQLQNYLY